MRSKAYIAIDLKSFYASVECVERGLDPLTTNLVVADESRTTKTICLAATPAIKSYGVPGRAQLFEVVQKVKEANLRRKGKAPQCKLIGESCDATELAANPSLALSYIVAKPRMALYMDYSTRIYAIYLRYIAPEDIHSYSIDEVFMDVTPYLATYHMTAHDLALRMIRDVLKETDITATAGIGTNLYLAKIAMDIVAKKMPADKDGVRIAELDEMSYRRQLWTHTPLTDFWRVGKGYAKKLQAHGLKTMGDVARCSIGKPQEFYNEEGSCMHIDYRLYWRMLFLLISFLCIQPQYCRAAIPPTEYEVWDRMPAEAVVNERMKATAPITLYNAPRGTTVVGSISAGEIVQRISCVVYTYPQKHPVKVLRALKSYKKNNGSRAPAGPLLQPSSYVYLLMYTGEGTYIGWYNGEEAWWLQGHNIANFSNVSPQQPWGEYVGEATSYNLSIEAWYCLRKKDGTTGWTMVAKNGDFSYAKIKTHRK